MLIRSVLRINTAENPENFVFGLYLTPPQKTALNLLSSVVQQKLQEEIPDDIAFPCETNGSRSTTRPTRADRVRPGDIDVVAALGDSLVAANGAVSTNVFQVLIANRGVSWAIGKSGIMSQSWGI